MAEARLVNLLFHDAEKTFRFTSILATWLSTILVFVLARRQFGMLVACVSAILLILNPTFWYAGLDSPLRPYLALFSLAVAYLCWRMWQNEPGFELWAAVVLGLSGGFRPDLLFQMFPLWCAAMCKKKAPWKTWIRGLGILFGLTVAWIAVVANAVGGLDRYALLMWTYTVAAMTESSSVLLNSTGLDWLYQGAHMIAWNGIGVLTWIWLVPLWLIVRKHQHEFISTALFFLAWILPGMIAQSLVHVAAPGHTLFSVTALCIIGGSIIVSTSHGISVYFGSRLTVAATTLVAVLNVLFFLNVVSLPVLSASAVGNPTHFLSRALAEGAHQSTFRDLLETNELSESSIQELKSLLQTPNRVTVISTLRTLKHFHFLSSRIASYYVADRDFWVVADEETPPRASRIRGKDLLEIRYGAAVRIPFPRGGRIIWLMDPASSFRDAVSQAVGLQTDGHIFHTDLDPAVTHFRIGDFEFVSPNEDENDQLAIRH